MNSPPTLKFESSIVTTPSVFDVGIAETFITPSTKVAVNGWVVTIVSPAVANWAPSKNTPFGFEIINFAIPALALT